MFMLMKLKVFKFFKSINNLEYYKNYKLNKNSNIYMSKFNYNSKSCSMNNKTIYNYNDNLIFLSNKQNLINDVETILRPKSILKFNRNTKYKSVIRDKENKFNNVSFLKKRSKNHNIENSNSVSFLKKHSILFNTNNNYEMDFLSKNSKYKCIDILY